MNYFYEHVYLVPVIAWLVAQLGKSVYRMYQRVEWQHWMSAGGMPSVHAATVMSLTTAMGLKYGIRADLFVVTCVFSAIVLYDAMNVRYESGLHAQLLNKLWPEGKLNTYLGHLPLEVLVGGVLGILVAFGLFYV